MFSAVIFHFRGRISPYANLRAIGPLHDPVTWHGINYTGTQITQWDFQNKGKSGWTGTSSFVLAVPLRNLRPSVIYCVPCDRIVQRAYTFISPRLRCLSTPGLLPIPPVPASGIKTCRYPFLHLGGGGHCES